MFPRSRHRELYWVVVLGGLLLTATATADDVGGQGAVKLPQAGPWDLVDDPVIREMMRLDAIAPFEDLAPVWDWRDEKLQAELDAGLARLGLDDDARRRKLAVAFVDVTDPERPRMAAVNGDRMMYAASLPKIAVLLGAFEKIAQGKMEYDDETRELMERMIQVSDNAATTKLMHRVGKKYIARVLLSPRYRLYDPEHNGGLWVGKDYAKAGVWKRDPMNNLAHAATALQVARFYYLLYTEQLVTPKYSKEMQEVMSGRHLDHKFVRALRRLAPRMLLMRKSGSWRTFHSDSALVERGGRAYIAVALANHDEGGDWMGQLIVELDGIMNPEKS
ncbi:MAG: serine hydrolase [Myxococcota bacterium]|nr:serine hydrolase [Myxococcota bacterium]MDP7571526.1 serine hydrolase [Myxococcota bacterium]HJO25540.1 serine hydrolase [Myxococcota bacterium]